MALETYRAKRDFSRTAEPRGRARAGKAGSSFVVQKHAARRLHYDLRIEIDENRKPAFFIDGNLVVGPSQFSAMTADSQMAVMAGVEVTATAAAQKSMDLRYVGAGRLFATS